MVHLAATAWVVRQLPCPYHSVGHQRLEYDRVPHVLPGLARRVEESAKLDGCNYYGLFFRIILPVSGPVFATLSLFTAVGYWNEWFNAGILVNNADLLPVQNYLINMINSASTSRTDE